MNRKNGIKDICGVILAAGLGRRMAPLTDIIPKPMIPVMGTPIIEIVLSKLAGSGAAEVHANLHHLASEFSEEAISSEVPLRFHFEESILGTGGGIGNMADSLAGHGLILLHNADIISSIEYGPAIEFHLQKGALVTMILASPEPAGSAGEFPPPAVYISGGSEVAGIGEAPPGDTMQSGYTGMAVLSPEALEFFPRNSKATLVEILLRMIERRKGSVAGYECRRNDNSPAWADIGTPAAYLELHRRIMLDRILFAPELEPPPLPLHVGEGADIGRGTRWEGFLEIGANASIGRDSTLKNCVVLPETVLERDTEAEYSVLFPDGVLKAGR